jgi:hypothetical protein
VINAQLNNGGNTACCKLTVYRRMWTEANILLSVKPNSVLVGCISLFLNTVQVSFCVTLKLTTAMTRTIHNRGLWDLLQSHCCEMYCITLIFNSTSFPESMQHTAFCTRCFLQNHLKHFMMPKTRGCDIPVQFGGKHATFTFIRDEVSYRWVAQLSTDNKIFLLCTSLGASSALTNLVNMIMVIHALLFA